MRARTLLTVAATATAATAAYVKSVRPWHLRWGATDEEIAGYLPGDEAVPEPDLDATRAITIDAPPEDVWPWVAQIGQDKAGCYSYRWLENIAGCHMPDVREIVPRWQHPRAGDVVYLHPKAPPLAVTVVKPGRDLVLADDWSFHLRPIDGGRRTRFIVRSRGVFRNPDLGPAGNFLYWRLLFEPAHFIMERKMLLNIKKLSEELAAEREARALVGVA